MSFYIDANIFAFAHGDTGPKGARARAILEDVSSGKAAITSALVIDEVMWVLMKNHQKEILRRVIENIYSLKNLEVLPVQAALPLKALDVVERYGLRPRDALHLAVMIDHDCMEIASDDADFDKVPHIKRIPVS